jgi:hypothetical protein
LKGGYLDDKDNPFFRGLLLFFWLHLCFLSTLFLVPVEASLGALEACLFGNVHLLNILPFTCMGDQQIIAWITSLFS